MAHNIKNRKCVSVETEKKLKMKSMVTRLSGCTYCLLYKTLFCVIGRVYGLDGAVRTASSKP